MKLTDEIYAEDFQLVVDHYLNRNRNILDTVSKYEISNARLSRAIAKAATQCKCLSIQSEGERENGIDGKLCKNCREIIEKEMGESLFYFAAICNALDISMFDTMLKEKKRLDVLGNYSLK